MIVQPSRELWTPQRRSEKRLCAPPPPPPPMGFASSIFSADPYPIVNSTLQLWLRADRGIPGATNGSTFNTWNDQSANALSLSPAGGKYVWNATDNKFGGQASVTAVSNSLITISSGWTTLTAWTYYCVFFSTGSGAGQLIIRNAATGGPYLIISPTNVLETYVVSTASFLSGSVSVVGSVAHVLCLNVSASNVTIYVDSSTSTYATASGTSSFAETFTTLGYTSGAMTGNYAEELVYNASHTTAQMAHNMLYFRQRYGLNVT